ncbi:hypothetical protein XELAEV_18015844mg [Xenopus laevis]|uniref:Uncharacterized protein n=1 Tax=Xenopus laevis TaxID=8355 RepID=A0A974HWC5_XENLA|nr:hypothetical protein XELAEV_18015844mg [Xenopus laevis]
MLILPIVTRAIKHQSLYETACSFSDAKECERLPLKSVLQSKRWVCPLWEKCTSCFQQTAMTSFRQDGFRLANKTQWGRSVGGEQPN